MLNFFLKRGHASQCVVGRFDKTIAQSVLLYGAEIWVVSEAKYASFHRCARFNSKWHIKPNDDGIRLAIQIWMLH
jgi:hypothetical protein